MKVSELVEILRMIHVEHGDLDVVTMVNNHGCPLIFDSIIYNEVEAAPQVLLIGAIIDF